MLPCDEKLSLQGTNLNAMLVLPGELNLIFFSSHNPEIERLTLVISFTVNGSLVHQILEKVKGCGRCMEFSVGLCAGNGV